MDRSLVMYPIYETRKKEISYEYKNSVHVPPHLHEAIEVVYVTKGSVELGVGKELYHMETGDFGIVFPNIIHHYQVFSDDTSKAIYLFIEPSVLINFQEELRKKCPENPIIKKSVLRHDIVSAIKALAKSDTESTIMQQAYAQIIVAFVFSTVKLVNKDSVGEDNLIYRAVSYVAMNFREHISLDTMAKELCISKYILSRMFSKTFHCNFCRYVNKTRLNYARACLEKMDYSITDISLDCGFESQRTFNRVFKEEYKMTPREYRNKMNLNMNSC